MNVTDCNADPNIPSGMADVCIKVLAEVKMGQMGQMTMNMFSCGMKVSKTKISSRRKKSEATVSVNGVEVQGA